MTKELLLKLPPFEVDADAPFGKDRLDRKPKIRNLTGMIKTNASPLVMAVDAPWGMGKTAFIKMWAAHIKDAEKGNILALNFNAWETDFASDPILPFLAEMENELAPNKKEWEQLQKAGLDIVSELVAGLGDILALSSGSGIVWKTVGRITKSAATNALQSHKRHEKAILAFKSALKKYIEVNKQRVVIFVDELDRCRPDYAVKTLERIKHLFEVPRVTFVLAINKKSLCHSIKGLYGAELDADVYLRRFIDFDFTLKEPEKGVYWGMLLSDLGTEEFLKSQDGDDLHNRMHLALILLDKIYGFSLRDAEQFMLRVNLILHTLGDGRFHPEFLVFLLATRDRDRGQLDSYTAAETAADATVDFWEQKIGEADFFQGQPGMMPTAARITACLIVAKARESRHVEDKIKFYGVPAGIGARAQYNREVKLCLKEYLDKYGLTSGMLDYHVNKIELLDDFRFPDKTDTRTKGGKG